MLLYYLSKLIIAEENKQFGLNKFENIYILSGIKYLKCCFKFSSKERSTALDDPKGRALMLGALQLRFSLVGGMFDTIQRNITVTTDWAVLLVQLISYGVVDLNNNS